MQLADLHEYMCAKRSKEFSAKKFGKLYQSNKEQICCHLIHL